MTQPYDPQQGPYHQQPGETTARYPVAGGTAQYPVTSGFQAAYPGTGSQPTQQPTHQQARRGKAVVVLAVLAVLLLAGTVTFGALYFAARSDQQSTADQLNTARKDLSTAQQQAQSAKTELQNTQTQLTNTQSQLTQANQDKAAAQNASSKDTACAAAARKALTATAAKNDAAAKAAIDEMVNAC